MAVPLQNCLETLAQKIHDADRLLVYSDFDGTLVPIHEHPNDCRLDGKVRDILMGFARADRIHFGIITGRELEDIRSRVALAGIAYAGNHGLEISAPGVEFREPTAVFRAAELAQITATLAQLLASFPGVWVQNKRLSASVHYRQANPASVSQIRELVRSVTSEAVQQNRFQLRTGKMTEEIRPVVDWHKGKAITWLSEPHIQQSQNSLTIYIGDDETDEDAFRHLSHQITIHVGTSALTAARYTVGSPADVSDFLSWIATESSRSHINHNIL